MRRIVDIIEILKNPFNDYWQKHAGIRLEASVAFYSSRQIVNTSSSRDFSYNHSQHQTINSTPRVANRLRIITKEFFN